MLTDALPWWAWVMLALVVLIFAVLEGAYRIIARQQRPLVADVRDLLLRHTRRGHELRERREKLTQKDARVWFDSVIADLTLVFSGEYAERVRQAVFRGRNVRLSAKDVSPKHLIRETQAHLDQIIENDLRDENLNPSGDLDDKLRTAATNF